MQQELTAQLSGRGSDGCSYVVQEYTEILPTPTYLNPSASRYGMKAYRLPSGESCNRQASAEFRVVQTGVIITVG